MALCSAELDSPAVAHLPGTQHLRQWVLHPLLDNAFQRTCAISRIVPLVGEPLPRLGVEAEPDLAVLEQPVQTLELDVDDLAHILATEAMEEDDFIDAVQELGPEMPAHDAHHFLLDRLRVLALAQIDEVFGAEVGGHDDEHIAEIDRPPLTVSEPPVVEHLQQD